MDEQNPEKKEQVEYYSDPNCRRCNGKGYLTFVRMGKKAVNRNGVEKIVSMPVSEKLACKCLKVVKREIVDEKTNPDVRPEEGQVCDSGNA